MRRRVFIPKGAHFVVPAISELVEDADSDLPDVLRPHLRDACSEIRELKDTRSLVEGRSKPRNEDWIDFLRTTTRFRCFIWNMLR